MNSRVFLSLVFASLFVPRLGLADDVDVAARFKVIAGKSKPAVLVTANKKVSLITLELKRDDGKAVHVERKKPPRGQQIALEFAQEDAEHNYSGELVVTFPNGTEAVMPLQFKVEVVSGEFAIRMGEKDLKLEQSTLTVSVGCDVDKIEVQVDGPKGSIDKVVDVQHGTPANTPITVRWHQPAGAEVLRIVVKPTCTNGVFREQHFFPWKYPVPHDEINFASGSDVVVAAEAPKLDAAYAQVAAALKKYGRWGKPSLWIAGHTDTVAGTQFNRELSQRRARSIAHAFRKRGLSVEIYYIGFGEEALVVETPDNTPEPRNRRAEYIIAVNEPEVAIAGFDGHWQKLH